MSHSPILLPAALREGDLIGLAAPASSFQQAALEEGIATLHALGFRVRTTPRIWQRYRYMAGEDAARAAELHSLFADPHIKAIFCCRGGYGALRLLPYLDARLIAANPKIFMGYSDLTTLLLYLYSQCRMAALHGPVVAGDLRHTLAPAMQRQLKGCLLGDLEAMQPPSQHLRGLTVLRPGNAEGILVGGCLSLLVCALGTPYQPVLDGTLLFLEDRGERLYRMDRMLTHLKLSGALHGVRGLVFGRVERVAADQALPYAMEDIILDVLGDLDLPILYGFPAGHCDHPVTLPCGMRAAITEGRLIFQEALP